MPDSSNIYCGPAGWGHAAFNPSPRPRGFHSLAYLASQFDAVEIRQSFHEFLKPELTRVWVRKVQTNPRFQFTVKVHRSFTHDRDLDPARVRRFCDSLRPLKDSGKLGCLLMQFPWSFRFTVENRKHFIALRRLLHEFPLAAEMRHASWMRDEALGSFIDFRVGFCNIDQPEYTKAMPPTSFLTSSIAYVRLHGRNSFRWFQPDGPAHRYDYLYSEPELQEWKRRVDRVSSYAAKTFVVFNNDNGSKALQNASEFQSLLGLCHKEAPQPKRPASKPQGVLFGSYPGRAVA